MSKYSLLQVWNIITDRLNKFSAKSPSSHFTSTLSVVEGKGYIWQRQNLWLLYMHRGDVHNDLEKGAVFHLNLI